MTMVSGLPDGNYLVQVRSGRHAGAEIALEPGTYLLGAGSTADIVLTDEGVAPGHVELRFEGEFCRFWSLDGAVRLPGRQLAPGVRGEARLPAEITVAGVELTLRAPVLARSKPKPWRSRMLLGAGGLVVVVGGGIGLVLSGSVPAFSTPALVASVIPDTAPAKPVVKVSLPVPGTPVSSDAAEVANVLAGRLGSGPLAGRVSVRGSGTVIEASGTLQPEHKQDWVRVQMWFDETYKGRFLLLDQIRIEAGAASPQLAIQAIWAGPGPYVIGRDGEKYGEGATLPGGWRIERIEREQVVVSRGTERVSLIP